MMSCGASFPKITRGRAAAPAPLQTGLLLAVALAAAASPTTNSDHVVHCENPAADCTAALQSALSDCGLSHVVVRGGGVPWSVGPLFIHRSNIMLTLEPGAVLFAKKGEFKNTGDSLLTIESDRGHGHVSNVTVVAHGATLKMRQMDYLPPAYAKGEWRHTLQIRGASDVAIYGGTYAHSGGDGIYVADGGLANFSRNILIAGATTSHAWRNGLSVISAVNLTVAGCSFLDTNGTNPQCGIDLEPDSPKHRLRGILLTNITLANNSKCGFTMGPYAFVTAGGTNPLDITVDGMRVLDTPGSIYSWGSSPGEMDGTAVALSSAYNLTGSVTVRNVHVQNCYGPALQFDNWPNGFVSTLINGLTIGAGATSQLSGDFGPPAPIQIIPIGGDSKDENSSLHAGGVRFENCTIDDDRVRDWLSTMWDGTHNHSTPPRLVNISGSVTVNNPAVTSCTADFGQFPISPDISVQVACNEKLAPASVAAPTKAGSDCRDRLVQPFDSASPWNTAIGSGAAFAHAGLFLPPYMLPESFFNDHDYWFVSQRNDPLTPVYDQGGWWEPAKNSTYCPLRPGSKLIAHLPFPGAVTATAFGDNNAFALLLPDQETLLQSQPIYRCEASGPLLFIGDYIQGGACRNSSMACRNISILSSGTESMWGSHGGSDISAIGGTIRKGELNSSSPPIAHALKLELDGGYYYFGGSRKHCYRWPADACDSSAPTRYTGTDPNVQPGSLLAVPVAVGARMTLSSEPAQRILQALIDYGGYLVDNTAGNRGTVCAEFGVSTEVEANYGFAFGEVYSPNSSWYKPTNTTAAHCFYNDMLKIFQGLHAIVNSGPGDLVGGGGDRRRPPPPPICAAKMDDDSTRSLNLKTDAHAAAVVSYSNVFPRHDTARPSHGDINEQRQRGNKQVHWYVGHSW